MRASDCRYIPYKSMVKLLFSSPSPRPNKMFHNQLLQYSAPFDYVVNIQVNPSKLFNWWLIVTKNAKKDNTIQKADILSKPIHFRVYRATGDKSKVYPKIHACLMFFPIVSNSPRGHPHRISFHIVSFK